MDEQKRLSLAGEPLSFFLPPSRREVRLDQSGLRAPPLPPPLPSDRSFPLPLPLGAGLLIEPPLPKLGIEPGPLNFPLEPAEGPVEAFVVLDENFQTDHAPFNGFRNKLVKVEKGRIQGNRPSRWRVWV